MNGFFGIFKKQNTTPDAPEPGFLDPPEGFGKIRNSIRDFLAHPWVKWGGGVFLVIFAVVILMPHHSRHKPREHVFNPEEKRLVMTTASMAQAIDAAAKPAPAVIPEKPVRVMSRSKRKMDSAIAVFIKERRQEAQIPERKLQTPKKKFGIPSGTKIPAVLEDRVFSFNVEAPVLAVLQKDFTVEGKGAIPAGSKFVGEANVLKSLDRINVRFQLLVLPDGREIRVNAMALSDDGAAGLKGKVQKHTDMKVMKAIGESVLSMGALFLGRGSSQDAFNLEDQLRLNVAQNLSDDAQKSLRSVKTDKSVTVDGGKPIYVFLLEAI